LNESDSGHLGFLARIPVQRKIWLGTVAEINSCIFSMICANFGAFTTKPTIVLIFDTNLLHYYIAKAVADYDISGLRQR